MSDERHGPPTFGVLAQQVQTQQRQIAMLTAARPAPSPRAGHARRLGVGTVIALILAFWGIIADEFAPYESNWLLRVYAICGNATP